MDIRNINTFLRVAELKSFTKVAAEMNYAQSTITMQIQQLEKELGYPLFDRIGKKVSLTSLGREFLAYAYEISHIIEKAENLNKDFNDIYGVLRVGVSESLMLGVLMDLLPEFKKKHKNLSLSFKSGHTTELLDALKQNQLDIVYISKSLNTDPDLHCCYSRKEDLVFLCGAEYSLAYRKGIPVSELLTHNFLVTEHEGICYGRLCELAAQYESTLSNSVEVDSVFVIAELLKKSMGLAFLPEYAVSKQIGDGTLIKLDVDMQPQTYYSQILCHKNRWLSPFMADFIEMIKSARPDK